MDISPFHRGELRAQELAGVSTRGAGIRDFMPDQHRIFFALLPYMFLGTRDAAGWPLASMLTGAPGFVSSPDPRALRIDALPAAEDPVEPFVGEGAAVGLLGLDLSTRRRNRANGRVRRRDGQGLTVDVRQSFGNCPQYIQARRVESQPRGAARVETLSGLAGPALRLVETADTLFVASASGAVGDGGGVDISHRGGRPGFVLVEGDRLTVPDFSGNRYFNTLGNLLVEPRASLLFVDFERGDMLQLQGHTAIDWTGDAAARIAGAERLWHFTVSAGWFRPGALPLRWTFDSYAPTTERTGTWRA
ncbi:pyridoxamine 5'-phosphate oxidase family protein [Phreatobacter sp. AB_2022a]|uniref:pyridoxamine 5'-phosphate oxidase family protein n=1 Tax=Phreatobacter sp. AB_2022a TaxID=3003134 RepID=UPI002286E59D|nr:pyridoxamine 5'-phosphate oxidase family protein [Phreatobacter sp. AB_2022a]MCZ0738041.1 pyridoxamine 5'-phosphate oxidase family protein [Phreatobacter sp. AB_2022a]